MERISFAESEKALAADMEAKCAADLSLAAETAEGYALEALGGRLTPADSAACARLICRFLLHRKNKSRLTQSIRESDAIRKAVFGCLNTYKHSLIFLLKRVIRENDAGFTREVLELMRDNPYGRADAKPYSEQWNAATVAAGALKAPEDYLNLSEESLALLRLNSSDSLQ